jgi:uncharacterized repeat protein (TIGR02543 family)
MLRVIHSALDLLRRPGKFPLEYVQIAAISGKARFRARSRIAIGFLVIAGVLGAGVMSASANNGALVSAPQSVQATTGPQSVTVSWSTPLRLDGKTISGYEVAYSTGGLPNSTWTSTTVAANITSHTFTGLGSSTAYYTRVRALVSGGQGAWGYPWTLAYRTTNLARNSSHVFVYSNTPADWTRTDYTRVRYRITATSTNGQFTGSYVDADFRKDYTKQSGTGSSDYTNMGFLRVPDLSNIFVLQGDVSDLTVLSDSTAVTNGSGLTGRIEIWPYNYGTSGGLSGLFDNIDTHAGSNDYGSFQLHSAVPQTIFAWNRHYPTGGGEIGFGQAPAGQHPDWTFMNNSSTTSNFSFESYANLPVTTPALSLQSTTDISIGILDRQLTTQPKIQLRSGGSNAAIAGVTVTASVTGQSLIGTTTAVTDSSGLATFSNLGFDTGNVGTSYTINFSATNYGQTTDSVTLKTLPTLINIVSSTSTPNGGFVDGFWYSDSAGTSEITASSLASQLAARSVTLEALGASSGNESLLGTIQFQTPVTKSSGSDQTLTLKSSRHVFFAGTGTVRSTSGKLNIVFWTDSEGDGNGGVLLDGPSSGYAIDTNGGHIAMGGGSSSTTWNGLTIPAGYTSSDGDKGSMWWGVELGVNQAVSNLKLIKTAGGSLRIYSESNEATGVSVLYGFAWEGGEVNTGSGAVEINSRTAGTPRDGSNNSLNSAHNFGVGIGVNNGGATDAPVLITSGAVSITGTTGSTASSNHQGVYIAKSDIDAGSSSITINSSRPIQFEADNTIRSRFSATTSSGQVSVSGSQNWGVSTTGTVAEISSPSSIVIGGAVSASGGLSLSGSSISTTASITSSSGAVLLKADTMAIGANVTASSGAVTISPATDNLQIDLGTETAGLLSLVDAELDRLLATVLRIGEVGGSNSGTINVTAALTPGGTTSLALRTSGSVIGTVGSSITETNLAIYATAVNLPGNNSITGNLAVNSTGGTINYTQTTGTFTPNTVDSIAPVYGVPSKVVLSDVPTNEAVDKFMAVTFNPPPVATLQDSYDKALTTANASADDYTITATKASGLGNLSGTTSVTTSTTGVATFSNLSISDTAGAHTITFTASVTPSRTAQLSGTPTATTGTYNIKIDQTVSFTSTAPTNARATGASYTPTATATSSLTAAITVDASASSVCSISAGVVTFQTAGTCVLNANQSGNSSYAAASRAQQSFSVAAAKLTTPATPTVSATTSTLKSIAVSWSAVTDAASYTIRVYDSPGTGNAREVIVGVGGTSLTLTASNFPGIADGTEYYISVSALANSSDGHSDEGVKAAVTTNSPAVTPSIGTQPVSASKTAGQSVTFSVSASRTDAGVLSYQWRKGGSNISGATSSSYTINPTATADAGEYTVVVTNSLNGTTATATSSAATLTMSSALSITTPSSGLSAAVNSAYSLTFSASGGSTPRTFSTASVVPNGITLSSAGVLSGTPTQSGTFAITATVTDANGATASTSSFNLVVGAAPGLTPTFGTPISAISGLSVQITNYDSNYTWSGTATVGTVSISNTGLVTFSGVGNGQSSTATITAARTHYANGSASVTATLTPIPIISYNSSDLNSFGTTTTVGDLSGRGNNATRSATVSNSFDIDPSTGAWKFPGGTNSAGPYIDLPDITSSQFSSGMTVDFEANFGSAQDWERVIDFGKGVGANLGPDSDNLLIGRAGTTNDLVVEVRKGSSVTQCKATGALATAMMYRWTISMSSNSCVITRDDTVLVNTNLNMSFNSITWSSNFIGRSNWSNDAQFEGQIRSLRIFAGNLTKTQIGFFDYKTVSYYTNYGSAIPTSARATTSGEMLLPIATSRTGYTFAGWYDSSNSSTGTKLGDAEARYTPSANIDLFAGWTANTNTVTFNGNNSTSGTMSNQSITTDVATALTANSFARTGYTFAGWTTASNGTGTAYTNQESVTLTGNLTLFAKWTANTLNVTFDSNGGNAVTGITTTTAASISAAPTAPTRAGYTFAGWFANSNLTGSAITFSYAHNQTADFTLYAKWTANTNTVTFNGNSSTSGSISNQSITTDVATALTNNAFARTGYTFAGWNTLANGNGTDYTNQQSVTLQGNLALFAKWTANTNIVTFDGNNSTSGSMANQSITSDVSTALTANAFSRAGYTFAGWATAANGTGTSYTNSQSVTLTGGLTLYAKWTANSNTIVYDAQGGSSIENGSMLTAGSIASAPVSTRAGYTLSGWSRTSSGSVVSFAGSGYAPNDTAGFTLYAIWSANSNTIVYNSQGGTAIDNGTMLTGGSIATAPAPTRAGYTLTGWSRTTTGSVVSFSGGYAPADTSGFTLYAIWSANSNTIVYNSQGGTAIDNGTMLTGGSIATAPAPTRAGYTLSGWSRTSSGSVVSFAGSGYAPSDTSGFTLYAIWSANTLNVTYQSNGGSLVTGITTTTGASISAAPTAPTRAGYTFQGWFANSDLTGSAISFSYAHGQTGDFTLYAKWTANTLNVTYNSNGGSPVTGITTTTAASISAAPTAPTRAGYTFAGWFDNSNLTGSEIAFSYAHGQTGDFTLYAKWTANTLNVTFDSNGGSVVTGIQTATAASISAAPTAPTRAGYTFAGWFANSNLTGSAIAFSYAHGQTGDFTLYAKWNANSNTIIYDSQGGSAVSNGSILTGGSIATAPAPTRAGYTLTGWSRTSTGSVVSFTGGYAPADTSGFTLYAIWAVVTNTVTYDAQGGSTVSNGSVVTGGTIASAPSSTRTGYTLLGWSRTSTGSVVSFASPGYSPSDTADFTMYARWSANTNTVTFNGNNATGGSVDSQSIVTDVATELNANAFVRAGYTFAGWATQADGGGTSYSDQDDVTIQGAVELFAKWSPNSNTVVYNSQGGTDVSNGTMLTGGSIATAPAPTRAGYTLSGWSRTTDGSVVSFSGGYAPNDTSGFTLYAIWSS